MASIQKVILTIPNGQSASNELTSDNLRNCRAMSVQAPAVLTGVVTAQSGSLDDTGGTFAAIQSPPGTDITCAAAKTTVFTDAPFARFRLQSSVNEAAQRDFVCWLSIGE